MREVESDKISHYFSRTSDVPPDPWAARNRHLRFKPEEVKHTFESEGKSLPKKSNFVDTVILGRGPTTSYFVEAMMRGGGMDPDRLKIIGLPNPWGKERKSVLLSQSERLLTPEPKSLESTGMRDAWMDTSKFSEKIDESIAGSKIDIISKEVKNVIRVESGLYKITYECEGEEQTIYARYVFDAMGAGKHACPFPNKDLVAKTKKNMDRDMFARVAEALELLEDRANKVIIVLGPKSGEGAVFEALHKGYKVKWVTGPSEVKFSPGTPSYGAILPYLKARLAKENDPARQTDLQEEITKIENSTILEELYHTGQNPIFEGAAEKFKKVKIDELHTEYAIDVEMMKDGKVEVKLQNGTKVTGDYLVYAVGPDLDPYYQVLDKETIRQDLVPRLDINHRFSDETVIGLQSPDGTLVMIGSAAEQLHGTQPSKTDVKGTMPANVPSDNSSPALRAKIRADLGYMPSDIHERVDFVTADRTMLVVHIVSKFACIAEAAGRITELPEKIAEKIIKSRRNPSRSKQTDLLVPDSKLPANEPYEEAFQQHEKRDLVPLGPNHPATLPYEEAFQQYWEKVLHLFDRYLQTKSLAADSAEFVDKNRKHMYNRDSKL